MKLSLLLTLVGVLQINAAIFSQGSKYDISYSDIELRDIFIELENSTDYRFFYSENLLDLRKKVDIDIQKGTIDEIVNYLLTDVPLTYRIFEKNLVVISSKSTFEQEITIKGRVTDVNGNSLPGVNIVEKGTTNGSVTNLDGEYSVPIGSPNSVLVFSYVGYLTEEIEVSGRTQIDISLIEDIMSLDEVVVVGYGSQSKRSVTGAIQSISGKEFEDIPTAQISQKLQGKLAGVQINQTTGIPGQGMSVRVRGQASISAGNDPLYVVDGFPITGDIANMNPDEIESISILKDASSAALYGSRAANGVVMITTKKAKKGQSNITLNVYTGIQQIPEKGRPDMMNAREFAQFKKEVAEENGQSVPEMFQNPEEYGEGTDWYDVITRDAVVKNYSVNYSTSKDKFSSSVVAGYFDQEGVLLNSNYKRYSLRVNSEYKFNEFIKVGVNASNNHSRNQTPQSDGIWYESPSIIQTAILASPLAPYINEDGTIPINTGEWGNDYGSYPAPNMYNQVQIVKNETKNNNLLANAYIEFEPLNGLKYKSSIGVDMGSSVNDFFFPSEAGGLFNPGSGTDYSRTYATHSGSFGYSWLWENILTYKKSIAQHNFDLLAGYSAQRAHGESSYMHGTEFPDNRIQTLNAALTVTGNTNIEDWSLASAFGRFNYNYDQKYILSMAMRGDGSSRFGADNRWGYFPSLSMGWVVTEEPFMVNVKPVSFLKLRASYGVTGNNNIGNYTQYANIVETNNAVNNIIYNGKSLDGLNNTDLGWETTEEVNVGMDFGILDDRIFLKYDYFKRTTDGLLYTVDIPISSGFYSFVTNIGKFEFWGHEFSVNTINLDGEFKWETNFNIAFNRNKALELGTANADIYGSYTITSVGEPLGQLYALKWEGVYMSQDDFDNSPKYDGAEVGTTKFADINGDGVVTNDDNDKTIVGSAAPKGVYGITNTFRYKGFDLTIVASGAYGHDIFNIQERFTRNLDGAFNVERALDNRWRSEENPGDGIHGKVKANTTSYERDWLNSRFLYDADYLTIKNITLGYQLPSLERLKIKGLRVYASVQQAFVFTKYPGNNPEVSSAGGIDSGFDHTTYPVPRTYTLGLNINL